MIDLHTHLIPGIDDGPATLEESLEMCRIAVAAGTTHAICTPHIHPGRWENTAASIERDCNTLQSALDEQSIPLQLGFAGEVRLTDGILQLVADNQVPFYGEVDGYNIMLLEFPHSHIIPGSEKLVQWLMNEGIRPLIAHPERNKQIMKDPAQLQPFVAVGCWLQLTAGSVTGSFGEAAKAAAGKLLEDGVVSVIASDGHNTGPRKPTLIEAFDHIYKVYGEDLANALFRETPAKIAQDAFSGHSRESDDPAFREPVTSGLAQ